MMRPAVFLQAISQLVFFSVLVAASSSAYGQSDSEVPETPRNTAAHRFRWWGAYMSQLRFHKHWSVWFDSHYNHETFFVLRPGMSFHFQGGPSLTGGYAYLRLKPGQGARLNRQEHRPWAQVVLPFSFSDAWRFTQRIRTDLRIRENVEQGAISDGWSVVFRPRLQLVMTYNFPLTDLGQPFVQLAEEILVNVGQVDRASQFDQNRIAFLAGWKYQSVTLRIGYMNRFLPEHPNRNATHEHTLLLWMNYNWNLLKEADDPPIPSEGTNT